MQHHPSVLMMSALVALVSLLSSVSGKVNELLAASTEPTPTKQVVEANNNFATDLYRQLAKANDKNNLFFSPYSIANGLLMAAEGARGKAAWQIGTVLRLPESVRNRDDASTAIQWTLAVEDARGGIMQQVGAVPRVPESVQNTDDDTTSIPWNLKLVHSSMADLRRRLTADSARTQEIGKKITRLEQEHQQLTTNLPLLEILAQWSQLSEVSVHVDAVARELNMLRQQVHYDLRVANALWGEQTFPFGPAFLKRLCHAYCAAALSADFIHNGEGARVRINRWMEEETQERIQNLLAEGTVTRDTRLVLTNGIYFKGRWANKFDQQNIQEADFTLEDGKTVKAMLMAAQDLNAGYAELLPDGKRNDPVFDRATGAHLVDPNPNGFQMLTLPYRGDALAMVILLPKRRDGVSELEQQLAADTLTQWLEAMPKQKVHVFLPQFTLEAFYDLPKTLSAMGMPAAFQPGELTAMSDAPAARTLALSTVVHKAVIEVDEEGTEAAATTAAATDVISAMIGAPPPPTFRADRPFLFLIRDIQSGAILFLGRVMNPREAA